MSPRRRGGLSPEDLQALKHLPAVLRALEHLQEQHAKVRALMGPTTIVAPSPSPEALVRIQAQQRASAMALDEAHAARAARFANEVLREAGLPVSATLDTPERREYEEAKKSGRTVPAVDPFANASPAQRERMAEQRAIIDAERAARGMPPRGSAPLRLADNGENHEAMERLRAEEAPVRTEPLDTLSDGTTPLADDADEEVH